MKHALLIIFFFGLWGCSDNTIENAVIMNEDEITEVPIAQVGVGFGVEVGGEFNHFH